MKEIESDKESDQPTDYDTDRQANLKNMVKKISAYQKLQNHLEETKLNET